MKPMPLAAVALALFALPVAVLAAGDRATLLSAYAAKAKVSDAGFAGFSAQRGETLYRGNFTGGDARTPSCATCHGADPRAPGRNAKTGRPIDPVAVSAAPQRYTDAAEVDKHFTRDCKSVLGRDCTALERGDYIAFMAGQ